jgi:hypothetical protein
MRRAWLVVFGLVASFPRAAWPQGGNPLGPEFRVNSYTTNQQRIPSVAADSAGDFVVVWSSYQQDGSDYGIFGQRYADSGAPLGPEFRVNTYTTGNQYLEDVASDSAGNFVVVWTASGQDGSVGGIFGRRYAASGAPLSAEFRVNTYTTDEQRIPSVASDSAGNFVVVWESVLQDGAEGGIFGRRFAASGAPLGPEFRVNTYTTDAQDRAVVTRDPSGNFVVVWISHTQDGSVRGIFGQRFAASGAPLGPEFRVNTYTTNHQRSPDVASDASGNFVVVWGSYQQDGFNYGVFGQRFASSGAPIGPEFRVNTYTTGTQPRAVVTRDPSGNFVVVWRSFGQDGSNYGIFGQRYASSGGLLGAAFRVNTYTTNAQLRQAVTSDGLGRFVVVWESNLQDGSGHGVFGQRYSEMVPVELMGLEVE